MSPVDVTVVAPDGRRISSSVTEIPGAAFEDIVDPDGHTTTYVTVPFPLPGTYQLHLDPAADASPDDIYTIVMTRGDETRFLARDNRVGDLPAGGSDIPIATGDTDPPLIAPAPDFGVEATSAAGTLVTYVAPTTDDAVDGPGIATCLPASGTVFPLGETTVTCSAHDIAGNSASTTFHIVVHDTTPPSLSLPDPIVVEATGPSGATVPFAASGHDLVDGSVTPQCSPAPGSTFPLGMTHVNCSATDVHGNTASGTFSVTVRDTMPPTLTLNGSNPHIVECHTAFTDAGATAADIVAGNLTGAIQVSGSVDPNVPGDYALSYRVSDGVNTASAIRTVRVVDTRAPAITSLIASPDVLWPANHKMVSVSLAATVADDCDAIPRCAIVSVASNEPVDGLGDGDTGPDWIVTGRLTVDLRAERAGNGSGRLYAITVRCVDASENASTRLVTVGVPHSR